MKYGLSDADFDAIKAEIHGILIGIARLESTITYSELAMQIRSAYIHYRAPAFDRILQQLCADEVDAGRPILGVVVVNKLTGRCGAGFYKWCALQGVDVSNPAYFWQEEYKRVCEYWQGIEAE